MKKSKVAILAIVGLVLILSIYSVYSLQSGATRFLIVLSGSMSPVMNPGDAVIISKIAPNEVKVGDVITFKSEEENILVTHRVIGITNDGVIKFRTKGDAVKDADNTLRDGKNVIGKVSFVIPKVGYFTNFMRTPFGFVLFIIIPGIVIIFTETRKILNRVNKKKGAKGTRSFGKNALLVLISLFLIFAISNPVSAYLDDGENSLSNGVSAGTLDLSLDYAGDFSPSVTPTQSSTRTISVENDGSLGFEYTVEASGFSGTLCDYLNLDANLDGGASEYTGSLKSFDYDAGAFSNPDDWVFTVTLTSSDSGLQSQTCTFNFVFDGSQIGVAGFSDQETISNTVTSGTWEVTTWIQTTQTDFDAGTKTNVASTGSGDVKLAATTTTQTAYPTETKDTYVDWNNYNSNYGSATSMWVGTVDYYRMLVQFDLSSIPTGATITSALLNLNCYSGCSSPNIRAYRIITSGTRTPWSETGVTFGNQPDRAGTFVAMTSPGTGWKLWELKNDVQTFVSGTYTNYGWMLVSPYTVGETDKFYTKEYTSPTYHPKLVVTYSGSAYYTSGTLESQKFDSGSGKTSNWQSLEWDETLPAGTDITLAVATSNDGSTWSSWSLTSGTSPIDLTSLPETRYIKWKATLTTSDTSKTPTLGEVRVKYYPGSAAEHVVLNEILPNPSGEFGEDSDLMPNGEWVEIYNKAGGPAVDLAGWYIKDKESNIRYITTSNTNSGSTIIGASGSGSEWLVVYMNAEILNNDGDTVYLYDMDGNLIDSYAYVGNAPENKSFARIPDGSENWVDPIPTPGEPNRLEEVLVENKRDLIVSSISWAPENFSDLSEGEMAEFYATIRNDGENSTEDIRVSFFIDEFPQGIIGETYIPILAPNESITIEQAWTSKPGEHRIIVVVDALNNISESNEENNRLSKELSSIGYPDLVVKNVILTPLNPMEGEEVNIIASIENEGARTSYPFSVNFYADEEEIFHELLCGFSTEETVSLTQSWSFSGGNHTIEISINGGDIISDANETNNRVITELYIEIPENTTEDTTNITENVTENQTEVIIIPEDVTLVENATSITEDMTEDETGLVTMLEEVSTDITENLQTDDVTDVIENTSEDVTYENIALEEVDDDGTEVIIIPWEGITSSEDR